MLDSDEFRRFRQEETPVIPINLKRQEADEIAKEVEAFIARGGQITRLDRGATGVADDGYAKQQFGSKKNIERFISCQIEKTDLSISEAIKFLDVPMKAFHEMDKSGIGPKPFRQYPRRRYHVLDLEVWKLNYYLSGRVQRGPR